MTGCRDDDLRYMQMAARLALRGHGGAEPNPLVGCVIVSSHKEVVGWGYHRRCGGPHAEIQALQRAGRRAAKATVYLTLISFIRVCSSNAFILNNRADFRVNAKV